VTAKKEKSHAANPTRNRAIFDREEVNARSRRMTYLSIALSPDLPIWMDAAAVLSPRL